MIQRVMPSLNALPYGGAYAIDDPVLTKDIYDAIKECADEDVLNNKNIVKDFLEKYKCWILDSELNKLHGLDKFDVAAYSNGTTDGFDHFMLQNHDKRFRCFKAEYMYHPANWRNNFPDWRNIEDEPLAKGDAVVMSMPFSDTGNKHPLTEEVLDICDRLEIPVLLDSAFYGVSGNLEFNYDRKCISDVTFSLSKTFSVANLRIGMRLRKEDNDDGLLINTKNNYTNRLSAGVAIKLLAKYSADYNFLRYRKTQLDFCEQLDVEPSQNSVIFGLSKDKFKEYNRGGISNRICFSRYLNKGVLPA